MPTQEERIAVLEQTTVSRIDYINGVNRLMLQMAQNASDTSHELTILLGVTGSQGQDIKILKEDVSTLKVDVSTLKEDMKVLRVDVSTLKGDVSTLKGDVSDIKKRLDLLETRANEHTTLLTQILARLPEKS